MDAVGSDSDDRPFGQDEAASYRSRLALWFADEPGAAVGLLAARLEQSVVGPGCRFDRGHVHTPHRRWAPRPVDLRTRSNPQFVAGGGAPAVRRSYAGDGGGDPGRAITLTARSRGGAETTDGPSSRATATQGLPDLAHHRVILEVAYVGVRELEEIESRGEWVGDGLRRGKDGLGVDG